MAHSNSDGICVPTAVFAKNFFCQRGHHGEVLTGLCSACGAAAGEGARISNLIVSTLQKASWEGSPVFLSIRQNQQSWGLTEAMALARMPRVQTPCVNIPRGPWSCEHDSVECNPQLGLGAPGPALRCRKRRVGCFTNVPMITYRHVLCLAAGLDPVGTAAVIGRGPHLHLSQHLAQ